MQNIGVWLDENDPEREVTCDEDDDVFWQFDDDAAPWWEDMVAEIFRKESKINLS
jgi:hypothetical protein